VEQSILNERELEFLLYELMDTEELLSRDRYAEHSREIFDEILNTAKKISEKHFANHNVEGDQNEPAFDGQHVTTIGETGIAWDSFAEAGFLAAHFDFEQGGMQLPEIILRSAMLYFKAANLATSAYLFLTIGAANLISSFASERHKRMFIPPMQDGRFSGTMALTESGQGSALADIKTVAKPVADGSYRIFGNKMFISGGDQDFTENIIHMVLARIEDALAGVNGISLFICPKFLVNDDGTLGEHNDVAVVGLLHKMGYRNTTSTALSFGEKEGAVGYLVGEPHRGLSYMFQMMNESRIAVASGAAAVAYQGFLASLNYARTRPQGRLPSDKNPGSKQVKIVEHADVRRMLLAQKAYAEGSLAMCLYASSLFEDSQTADTDEQRKAAYQLLDLITPVVKSWPSKYGVMANDLAIQVLGGAGYTREYRVEQYYRDNRLNPIHEGTEGIQGLDILGRKVFAGDGAGLKLLLEKIRQTVMVASESENCHSFASSLDNACDILIKVTEALGQAMMADVDLALANATVFLDMFGRVFVSWLWLQQACIADQVLSTGDINTTDENFYRGKLQAARYYFNWELPQIGPQADLLVGLDRVPFEMRNDWF